MTGLILTRDVHLNLYTRSKFQPGVVLSLFLIFGQISLDVLIKFVFIKNSVYISSNRRRKQMALAHTAVPTLWKIYLQQNECIRR